MGRNRKKKYYYSSGSLFALGNDAKPADPDDPSIYKGGNRDEHGDIITNIVFQPEYRHLSPEELRFQDHGFTAGYPYSYEEARWRHYLDTGRASLPKFGAQTPGSPFSISDSPQDGHRSSSSPPQTPNTVNDEKSTTSTCSLCAARLTLDSERHGAYEASTEGVVPLLDEVTPRGAGKGEPSRGTATPSHYKKTRSKKNRQRIRRLEKTVESLSHGLILALTELKSGALKLDPTSSGDRRARPDGLDVESDFGDEVDALSMAFTSLKTTRESRVGMCTELLRKAASAGAGTSVPPRQSTEGTRVGTTTTRQSPSLEPLTSVTAYPGTGSSTLGTFAPPTNSRTQQLDLPLPTSRTDRERGTHSISNRLESELPVITTKTMGSDKSLSTSNDRSPISGLLEPILRFMTCPDVFQFLKEAENHDGLKGTQMSDLSWVLDNLFDIHGGMMIHCLRQSLKHMNDISQSLGSNTWSQDLKLMQELDKAYCKNIRPCIKTDGDCDTSTSIAWKAYCLELVFIFSERFPKSASVNFRDLAEGYKGFLDPIITTSYIEDLNSLWTQVHPALLEVTRWFEPFIDYGPDYHRLTPFYDATIALGHRVGELLSRHYGTKGPAVISLQVDRLLDRLRAQRSKTLVEMQLEMESVMNDTVSRSNSEAVSLKRDDDDDVLVKRAKEVTGWQEVTEEEVQSSSVQQQEQELRDELALHQVKMMKRYRPRLLLCPGTAASQLRQDVYRILTQIGIGGKKKKEEEEERCSPLNEKDVFWDGILVGGGGYRSRLFD